MDTEHVQTAAENDYVAEPARPGPFGAAIWEIHGFVVVRVYDSPADRLAAEHATGSGSVNETTTPIPSAGIDVGSVNRFRCFASCGAVSLEVYAADLTNATAAWVNQVSTTGQAGLNSIFGDCPAASDVGANPPTVGTWPTWVPS